MQKKAMVRSREQTNDREKSTAWTFRSRANLTRTAAASGDSICGSGHWMNTVLEFLIDDAVHSPLPATPLSTDDVPLCQLRFHGLTQGMISWHAQNRPVFNFICHLERVANKSMFMLIIIT